MHVFEYSETHPYNRPDVEGNARIFPIGHECLCGEKTKQPTELNTKIIKGSMFDSLTREYIKSLDCL